MAIGTTGTSAWRRLSLKSSGAGGASTSRVASRRRFRNAKARAAVIAPATLAGMTRAESWGAATLATEAMATTSCAPGLSRSPPKDAPSSRAAPATSFEKPAARSSGTRMGPIAAAVLVWDETAMLTR